MISLAPEMFAGNSSQVIFKLILQIESLGVSCKIPLRWTSQDLTNDN